MRRSKGFILTEILMGLFLHAMFLVTLCGAFYLLLTFGTRMQQILIARGRGQRVIDYVDQRIKNSGIGLWRCRTPEEITDAMYPLAENSLRPLYGLCLPVDVRWDDKNKTRTHKIHENGKIIKYCGNELTIFYAHKSYASKARLIITTEKENNYQPVLLEAGQRKTFQLLAGKYSNYSDTDFKTNLGRTSPLRYLTNWAVMESAGVPLYINNWGDWNVDIKVNENAHIHTYINSGSELLALECERMFTGKDSTTDAAKSFRLQKVTGNSWGNPQPHELSILEVYFELCTEKNHETPRVLNMYVLASGGKNNGVITHNKPKHWPDLAIWEDEYKYHTVYVLRASWKLENLSLFSWN